LAGVAALTSPAGPRALRSTEAASLIVCSFFVPF
jgi:hypothetical protein